MKKSLASCVVGVMVMASIETATAAESGNRRRCRDQFKPDAGKTRPKECAPIKNIYKRNF